jgi:hypothetical protein
MTRDDARDEVADEVATVRRVVDLDVPASELERHLHDLTWLGDEVAIDRRAGGLGRVREGGAVRHLHVDHAGDHELRFHWWPEAGDAPVSAVRLAVEEHDGGSRLVVEETLLAPSGRSGEPVSAPGSAPATASARTAEARAAWWDLRLDRLAARCAALVPA